MYASKYTFNSLFIEDSLYGLINNEHVHIQDGIFTDKGYLFCTSDFDSFINHVEGEHIVCLQFDMPCSFEKIDVCVLLLDYNGENEFILPKGLQFSVEQI